MDEKTEPTRQENAELKAGASLQGDSSISQNLFPMISGCSNSLRGNTIQNLDSQKDSIGKIRDIPPYSSVKYIIYPDDDLKLL